VRDLENRFIHETPALYHIGRVSGLRRTETLVIPAFFPDIFHPKSSIVLCLLLNIFMISNLYKIYVT
jgi:hypothetical protein